MTAALEAAGADIAAFSKPVESAPVVAPDYFPVMGSFEVPTTWDESYDVVVVGGGFAGLAAAYGAVENGSSVVLVEKLSTTGGKHGGGAQLTEQGEALLAAYTRYCQTLREFAQRQFIADFSDFL